jgi:hypothetical protein
MSIIRHLVRIATDRGHTATSAETPETFLERVIREARTRREIAQQRAHRRRNKKRNKERQLSDCQRPEELR